MIGFEVPKGTLAKLEKSIKQKLANAVEDIGLQIYNTIVMDEVESPYYSGSYISSWNISKGIPKAKYNVPTGVPRSYDAPSPQVDLGGISFGQRVYISNAAPHAKQVEYEGTPRHAGGWFVATHAKNKILMSYKFRMRP